MAEFKVRCFEKSDKVENDILHIEATFTLIYDIKQEKEEYDGVDDDIIELFVRRNVPVNAWPYGREIISSLTTRMGFPPLIIGTFKTI